MYYYYCHKNAFDYCTYVHMYKFTIIGFMICGNHISKTLFLVLPDIKFCMFSYVILSNSSLY